jgi:hypothetical protein
MKFHEKNRLARRGPIEQASPVMTATFLVAERPVASWEEDYSDCGYDYVDMFPAHVCGVRAWLVRRTWCPASGYSAGGVEEKTVGFEDGVRLLCEHGSWEAFGGDDKEE